MADLVPTSSQPSSKRNLSAPLMMMNDDLTSPTSLNSQNDPEDYEEFEANHSSAFKFTRVRTKTRFSKNGRPYEFAIQLNSWVKDSGSSDELFAEELNLELVEIFGTTSTIQPMPRGKMDIKHGYFKVAASVGKLEEWAEEDGIRVRVKPWIGGDHKAFTRQRRPEFAHPGCTCKEQEDCLYCCATAPGVYHDEPEKCKCLLLLPYQCQILVRSRIEKAFDNLFRARFRQEAKAKGQNIMVTEGDVRRFLIKFCEHGKIPPNVADRLLELFKNTEGEDFQRFTKVELARLVTPEFGSNVTDHLYDAIQSETKDDIIVRPGQGLSLALKEHLVKQIYPLHTLSHNENDLYPTRRDVLRQYCTWIGSAGTCMIFSQQNKAFLNFLRDYLGEKIALYFAFLHYYTTWLVPLACVGTPLVFTQWTSSSFDSAGIIVYCVIVALWSTVMLEFWQRKNAELSWRWDMTHFEVREEELDKDAQHGSSDLGFYEKYGAWVDMSDYISHSRRRGLNQIERFVRFENRDKKSPIPDCMMCVPGGPDARMEMGTVVWRLLKQMLSWSVVSSLLVIVIFLTLLLLYFRLVLQSLNEVLGGLIVGSITAFMIAVFDFLFEGIALHLTNFENHRTATQYEDQLIAKQFIFQFVNSYFSLFYIAFFKGGRAFRSESDPTLFGKEDRCKDVHGNDSDSCMAELAYQLTAMLITRMFIGNLMEYWAPHAQYKANMWKLWYGARRAVKTQHPDWTDEQVFDAIRKRQNSHHYTIDRMQTVGDEYINKKAKQVKQKHPDWSQDHVEKQVRKSVDRHRHDQFDAAEKQAYQAPYSLGTNVSGTFYDYAELAIQFGYVTIFAPAFPLAPLVAIISNVIEHRQDAYKILISCQRPDYKGAQDMGTWFTIFKIISYVAVITNFLIIAFTSDQLNILLDDPPTALKLAVVVIAEHIVFALKSLMIYTIPAEPYKVRVARAKSLEIQRAETDYREYLEWIGKNNTRQREHSAYQEDQAYKQHLRDHAHELLYLNADISDVEVEEVDPLSSPNDIVKGKDMEELKQAPSMEDNMQPMNFSPNQQQQVQFQQNPQMQQPNEPPLPGLNPNDDDEEYVYRSEEEKKKD